MAKKPIVPPVKGKGKVVPPMDKGKGVPKQDGSGKGVRANKGRGGTPIEEQQKVGKGKKLPKK